jgi:hypothetical protein
MDKTSISPSKVVAEYVKWPGVGAEVPANGALYLAERPGQPGDVAEVGEVPGRQDDDEDRLARSRSEIAGEGPSAAMAMAVPR